MNHSIEAILFDSGGTLRRTIKRDDIEKRERLRQIQELIGSTASPIEFMHMLTSRYKDYQQWAELTLDELDEEHFWTEWMLPDYPEGQVRMLAHQLNYIWREAKGIREFLPETRAVVTELFQRGYRLGIVSNTISRTEIPRTLKRIGISDYIGTVVLSSQYGRRKPDPSILLTAAKHLNTLPEYCAYVGNRPDRDVAAARRAGFAIAITISKMHKPVERPHEHLFTPDHRICSLNELLEIFPPRN